MIGVQPEGGCSVRVQRQGDRIFFHRYSLYLKILPGRFVVVRLAMSLYLGQSRG